MNNSILNFEIISGTDESIYTNIKNYLINLDNCLISGGSSLNFYLDRFNLDTEYIDIDYYLTDERVSLKNSNIKNILDRTNNKISISPNYNFKNYNKLDYLNHLSNYFKIKQSFLKVAIIGFGDDGHLFSLFDRSNLTILKKYKNYFLLKKKDEDYYRLSLNLDILINLEKIFIVINSKKKLNLIESIIKNDEINNSLPLVKLFKLKSKEIILVRLNFE